MPVGIDPRVDFAFKWVFGREETPASLIGLIHAVLEPTFSEQITEIRLLNPYTEKMALDEKLAILDIKARDQFGRLLNVEMQMLGYLALPQRFLFYWSKLYTEQIQAGMEYHRLRPTISICFVDDILFPAIASHHSCFRLIESNHGIAFTDDIQIHLCELPKFLKTADELTTPLDRWLYFLKHGQEMDVEKLPAPMDTPEIRQAMEALTVLSQRDIEKEIYEGREKAIRDERSRLSGALEKGMLDGMAQGMAQGITQGFEKGSLAGRVQAYEEILGIPGTPRAELESRSIEELQQLVDALRQRMGR